MLYSFLSSLTNQYPFLNIFDDLIMRSGLALLTSLTLSFLIMPRFIQWVKMQASQGQPIREDGPQEHLEKKKGTPTMGGLVILITMTISTLLWINPTNSFIWPILFITLGYGGIGMIDDILKLKYNNSKGLKSKHKLLAQGLIALMGYYGFFDSFQPEISSYIFIPFTKDFYINLGILFIPCALFIIIGSSNAVNLTDGLDGLACFPIIISAASFGFIAYLISDGQLNHSLYFSFSSPSQGGELTVFLGALIGSCLAFLWFNAPPAMIFMGDTGSIALGGALGAVAIATKHELTWAIIGGIFVMETLSVIIQVIYFKFTGKRFFYMAPIHHHFEQKNWSESTIVIRFWIISIIFAIIGLFALKI